MSSVVTLHQKRVPSSNSNSNSNRNDDNYNYNYGNRHKLQSPKNKGVNYVYATPTSECGDHRKGSRQIRRRRKAKQEQRRSQRQRRSSRSTTEQERIAETQLSAIAMFCPVPSFWGFKDLGPPTSHQEYLATKSTSSTSLDASTPSPRKSLVPGTALTVPPTPDTPGAADADAAATTEESSVGGSACNSLPEAAPASIGSGSTNAKSAPVASSEVVSPQRPRILEFNQKLERIERLKETQKEETETTASKDQPRSDIDNDQEEDDDDAKTYEQAAISPLSFVLLAVFVALVYSYQSGNLRHQLDGVSSGLVQHAPSSLSSLVVVSDSAPATALGSNSTTLTVSPPPLDAIFREAPKPSSILASAASSAKTATQKILAEVAEIVEDAAAARPLERQPVVVPEPVSKPAARARAKATPRANTEAQTTSDATSHGAASVLWSYLPGTAPKPAPAPEPVQFFPLFAGLDRFLLENAKKTRTGLRSGLDDLTENVRKHKEWRLARRKRHRDEANRRGRGRQMGNLRA